MDFGDALNALRAGASLTRLGWNGAGQCIALQMPDEYRKMTPPYLYLPTVTGDTVPWLGSQTDILAEDGEKTHAE